MSLAFSLLRVRFSATGCSSPSDPRRPRYAAALFRFSFTRFSCFLGENARFSRLGHETRFSSDGVRDGRLARIGNVFGRDSYVTAGEKVISIVSSPSIYCTNNRAAARSNV